MSTRQLLLALALLALTPIAGATEYFVSLSGNDANPGTIAQPFRTIAKGVSLLQAGDILNLRQGVYVGPVDIAGKQGTAASPILIRSFPGEHAYIDGSVPQFRTLNNSDWTRAALTDPQAHPDEYVSVATFGADPVNRGAFLDRNPYTRLITYSNVNDFRADNQTFDRIDGADPRPGPAALEKCPASDPDPACTLVDEAGDRFKPAGFRRPWVYMGPGLWFDGASGKVHVRLSHTANHITGLADYTGETDPRRVRLAISPKDMITLSVRGARDVRIQNLSVRYGGEFTIHLQNNTNLTFDHVRLFGGSYGMRGTTNGLVLSHCEFDGGLPTWYFRSDRKAEYYFLDDTGAVALNNLGKQTLRALLLGGTNDAGTQISNSEFKNAHDAYLIGNNFRFHHNWIDNLNDEGLFLDAADNQDVRIYQNVITKTLSPISFAGARIGGTRYIFRNLVDVRAPTAGFRPRFTGDTDVWRYGNTFKSNETDGPYALFQNTFLVYKQEGQASYLHYRSLAGTNLRRSFNNIFVAVNPDAATDRAITFLPSPCFPGPTDGNDYFRLGVATTAAYRFLPYSCAGASGNAGTFASLPQLRASAFFQQSKNQYAPGYEARSIESNPQFQRIGADGLFRTTDDLRLRQGSPAIGGGVILPDELLQMDPLGMAGVAPDIGVYPFGGAPLIVGVDGRKSFPQAAASE